MPVYFAKFCNDTGHIQAGGCGLDDWAAQETSASECVVQTAREYMPDELFVGDGFVLRVRDTGEPVAIDEPLTRAWLDDVEAKVLHSEAPDDSIQYVRARLPNMRSRAEARALVEQINIAIEW